MRNGENENLLTAFVSSVVLFVDAEGEAHLDLGDIGHALDLFGQHGIFGRPAVGRGLFRAWLPRSDRLCSNHIKSTKIIIVSKSKSKNK